MLCQKNIVSNEVEFMLARLLKKYVVRSNYLCIHLLVGTIKLIYIHKETVNEHERSCCRLGKFSSD